MCDLLFPIDYSTTRMSLYISLQVVQSTVKYQFRSPWFIKPPNKMNNSNKKWFPFSPFKNAILPLISRTNLQFPWKFEKSRFYKMSLLTLLCSLISSRVSSDATDVAVIIHTDDESSTGSLAR